MVQKTLKEKRPLADASLEGLIGCVLTFEAQAYSRANRQEPGHTYLEALAVGYYSLEELRRRLSIDDWKWWLKLFRSVGVVKQEAKNA